MDCVLFITEKEMGSCIAWSVATIAVAYAFYTRKQLNKAREFIVNPSIQKDSDKVAHSYVMEDLENKTVFCRCWRSKKFPYCDGSHNKYNKEANDNVGPLIVQKSS